MEYRTVELDLPDRESVKEWMIKNQLGRRNLTPQEASYYRGKLYEARKLSHGGDRKSKGQNVLLKTTAMLATSSKTILFTAVLYRFLVSFT